jgi:ribonucleoside-diphosphate reductase alpha chain
LETQSSALEVFTTDNQKKDTTPDKYRNLSYHELNALLNLYDEDGKIQFGAEREAARQYFLQHVNNNTVFFHDLKEKIEYLIEEEYYEPELFEKYSYEFVKSLFKRAYAAKFRFSTFLGAFKFYTSYALKTFDGQRYLERYEDRVCMTALLLADGDTALAERIVDEIISGRLQPATPTFLNAGKKQRGELVSCFLLSIEDNMESIGKAINNSLQLSKRGGGVALCLTNLRESGAPIKKVQNQSSGVIPVMKLLEDAFSYANQLGARQGAGAVYLHAHHPDIYAFLDTKRENADEKVRIKTLSLGVVIPDITFELAKRKEDMYLFSPYDVEKVYGVPFAYVNVSEKYYEMVDDARIRKTKINAREFFQTLAEIQFESGYPYIMFEDTVNHANPIDGKVIMSNLCLTGDTRLLTTNGYKRFDDLYASQEDFQVVSDNRSVREDFTKQSVSIKDSTRAFLTQKDAETFKISTKEGWELKGTAWHKFPIEVDGKIIVKRLAELEPGDHLLVQPAEGVFGSAHNPELAYIAGVIASDGSFSHVMNGNTGVENTSAKVYLYGDKAEAKDAVREAVHHVLLWRDDLLTKHNATLTPEFVQQCDNDRLSMSSAPLAKVLEERGFNRHTKNQVPEFVWQGDKDTVLAYLSGLFQMDACITGSLNAKNISIELGSTSKRMLQEVQVLLGNLGVYSRIYVNRKEDGTAMLPDGKGGYAEYNQKANWTLRVSSGQDRSRLYEQLTWLSRHKKKWDELSSNIVSQNNRQGFHKFRATITSIEFHAIEDVYDVTVDDGHSIIVDGVSTRNCSEILEVTEPSTFKSKGGEYDEVGKDISCNLASLNIAATMDGDNIGGTVEAAIRALTSVSDLSNIESVPPVERGNDMSHAVGLGQMNLHGYLAREHIFYGSEEALDFTNIYFYTVAYHAVRTSMLIAKERGVTFDGFEKSKYATGEYFKKYTEQDWVPQTERVRELFANHHIPTREDWAQLAADVAEHGMYNQNLQAVPPTGSISYINGSTSSIHPIASKIEIRKEGKLGRVYYPAPFMTNENLEYYQDAYEIGYEKIIDTYAVATQHVDQGLSLTLFFPDTATTRDINRAQIYAWKKGIKTLYYIRLRQQALEGTQVEGCVSCML